ncbi:hypothetical protein D3C76_854410 [compost metagenome]
MQGMGDILSGFDQFFLFDIPQHFRRRFRTRCQHEVIGQAIDHLFLAVFFNDIGRSDQRDVPGRGGGSQPGTHLTFGVGFQQVTVHIAGAAAHHVTGHDVFCDGGFHKSGGCINLHFARFHIRFIHHAAHAAVVVHVAVGINHGYHRFLTAIFKIEIHPDFRCFSRDQRINDGDAFFTFNNRHIRQIEITDLIHPVGHFE